MRKVYASYVKRQMEEQPDSVILFLLYYDTTDNVRSILNLAEIQQEDPDQLEIYEFKGEDFELVAD